MFLSSINLRSLVPKGLGWPSFLRLDTCKASSVLARIIPLAQIATVSIATRASGMRLPQGGWCGSLTPAQQIALVASLLNIPANKRNNVLLNMDSLMEGCEWTKEIPHVIVQAKEFLPLIEAPSGHELVNIMLALNFCSYERGEIIVAKAKECLKLMERPFGSGLVNIIKALKTISDERGNVQEDVLAQAKEYLLLMSSPSGKSFAAMITALKTLSDKQWKIGTQAKEYLSSVKYSFVFEFGYVLKALKTISDERGNVQGDVLAKAKECLKYIKHPLQGRDLADIIKALKTISDERGNVRGDVLSQVKECLSLMEAPSRNCFVLVIRELNEISPSERDDVVEKTKTFLEGKKFKSDDLVFLLRKLASIPKGERKKFPLQAAIEEGRYVLAKHLIKRPESLIFPDQLKVEEWLTPPCLPIEDVIEILSLLKMQSKTLTEFFELYENHSDQQQLIRTVFKRIVERHPLFVRGKEERPDLVEFIRKVLELADNEAIRIGISDILKLDFKLNQGLPLRVDILEKIVEIFTQLKEPKAKVRFRLALQTHDNFAEIVQIAEGIGFVEELPSQEAFFKKDLSVQIAFMRRAQVFRDRAALPMAFEVIKQAVSSRMNEELLQQSIQLLRKTEIANSASRKHLMTMIESERFPPGIRQSVCHAVAKVESNPTTSKRKVQLFEILKKESNPQIQTALVECLSVYEYANEGKDQEITKYLCSLARETNHDDLKRALAFALTLMPDQAALKQALAIVKSPIWGVFDQGREYQDRVPKIGDFGLFNYRPGFHDNRNMMRKAIVERLVTMYRKSKKAEIERKLLEYRAEPSNFPNMKGLEEALYGIKNDTRYIPFGIFLPEDRVLLRALSERQGPELLDPALHDFFLTGSGAANLWLMDRPNQATWAKVGQVFSSTDFSYTVGSEFSSKNGFLIAINPHSFNQALLQHGRFEREGGLHAVSYQRIGHGSIASVFVPQDPWQSRIEAEDLSQIQAERLKKKSGTKQSLQDRVVYFDPEADLPEEMTRLMQEQRLNAMTMHDIVEENLTRQALREMLAEDTDVAEELRDCIMQCGYLDAGPNQKVFGPINQPPNLITVNPRPASPIEVTVPIAVIPKGMTLEPGNFAQIFALINQYTVNIPYPHDNDSQEIAGQIVHRKNHNGTHSSKQARLLEALFALMEKAGPSPMQKLFTALTQEERMHFMLAAYVLRAGRVDESDFSHPHPDDFYTRSALIYEAYARQFSDNEDLIGWVKKLIFNSVKPEGVREADIDSDPKNRLGFELLSTAHELDLIRCLISWEIKDKTQPSLRRRLQSLFPYATNDDRETCLKQLIEFAKGLCAATGCKRAYDFDPGNDALFAKCSTDGAFCWKQVQSVEIPKF